ncbi:hypothetical protein [Nocardia sp. NPDC049149]|uniref:hypothetical protein n=1 Tax=Nocardia sp. NPDC049149 TaxID=3364315 RepID=UPI0037244D94
MTTPGLGARTMHGITDDETSYPARIREASNAPQHGGLMSRYDPILADVVAEISAATSKFTRMRSMHEGYAVLLEEVDEMWDDIKANRWPEAMAEAQQVAAMAIRFIHDMQVLRAAEAGA